MKLFVFSIERGTSRRVCHRRPWLSDMSQLGGCSPVGSLRVLAVARVGVSDRRAQDSHESHAACEESCNGC